MKINKIIGFFTLLILSVFTINAALIDGQIAYYKLDGNGTDATGNGLDMTATGTVTYTTGIINQGATTNTASTFDSPTNNYGDIKTINLWFNANTNWGSDNGPTLVSYTTSSTKRLYIQDIGSGNYRVLIYSSSDSGSDIFQDRSAATDGLSSSGWHMLTLVTTANDNTDIYVDGSYSHSIGTKMPSYTGTGTAFLIASNMETGVADEIGFWNTSKTSTEVTELYNSGASIQYPYAEVVSPTLDFTINDPVNESVFNISLIDFNVSVVLNNTNSYNMSFFFSSNRTTAIQTLPVNFSTGVEDAGGTFSKNLNSAIMFGGDGTGGVSTNIIKLYNLTSGTVNDSYGTLPSALFFGNEACLHRRNTSEHYCYGGASNSGFDSVNQVIRYDDLNNSAIVMAGLTFDQAMYYSMADYDSKRDVAYIFGGHDRDVATAFKEIYMHNFTANTLTKMTAELPKELLGPEGWYDILNDRIIIVGGTGKISGVYSYNQVTMVYYPENDTLITLGSSSNPLTPLDTTPCVYSELDGNGYCFGGIPSSGIAPYDYMDNITMFDSTTLLWSDTGLKIQENTDDYPVTLNENNISEIILIGNLQEGSAWNVNANMTGLEKFTVFEAFNDTGRFYSINNTDNTTISFSYSFASNISSVQWFLNGTFNDSTFESDIYNFQINITIPTDTCTPPAINNDWIINSTDDCFIDGSTIDLGTGGIYYTDSGSLTFNNSDVTVSFFERQGGDSGTDTQVYLYGSACMLQ